MITSSKRGHLVIIYTSLEIQVKERKLWTSSIRLRILVDLIAQAGVTWQQPIVQQLRRLRKEDHGIVKSCLEKKKKNEKSLHRKTYQIVNIFNYCLSKHLLHILYIFKKCRYKLRFVNNKYFFLFFPLLIYIYSLYIFTVCDIFFPSMHLGMSIKSKIFTYLTYLHIFINNR